MESQFVEGLPRVLGEFQTQFEASPLASEPKIGAMLLESAVNSAGFLDTASRELLDVAYTHADRAITTLMRDGVTVDFGKHSVSAHVAADFFRDFFRTGIEQGKVVVTRKDGLPEQHGIANVHVSVDGAMYCFVREKGFYHPDYPDEAVSSEVLLTFGPAFSQGTEQLLQSNTPDGVRRAAALLKRVGAIQEGIKASGEIYTARQDRRHYFSLSLGEEMRIVTDALTANPYTGLPRPSDDLTKSATDGGMPYEMCLSNAKDVSDFVAGGKTKELLLLRLADARFRQRTTLKDEDSGRYQEAMEAIEKDITARHEKDKV